MPAVLDHILAKLPHQPPFRFITTLDQLVLGEHGCGTWVVTGDEWFLKGHFPDHPIVPGVLLTEAMAQLAGLVAFSADESASQAGRLAQVDVRFVKPVAPPVTLTLVAHVTRMLGTLGQFDVRAEAGGETCAHGSLVIASGVAQ